MRMLRLILLVCWLFPISDAAAQLVFDAATHDFGTIEEQGGVVRCRFVGTNRGTKPVVVLDVATTCGCTVPTFTKKPIRPGEETVVEVAYDPDGRPGTFDRKLHLFGPDRERLAVLTIRGTVRPRPRSVEELYPVAACDGVRFASSLVTLTYIYVGAPVQTAVSLINTADRPRTLELRPRSASGLLRPDYPRRLEAGERSAVNLLYRNDAAAPRYGTIRDALEVWIDGRRCDELLLVAHGIGVDRPTAALKAAPPKAEPSANVVKFGTVARGAKPLRQRLTIRNPGRSELRLRAAECEAPFSTTLRAGARIAPGDSLAGEVLFDPAAADYGFATQRLLLVTDDPVQPMRRIRLTAVVEER